MKQAVGRSIDYGPDLDFAAKYHPVREQLSAQLRFGILSGRLAAEERLPSVRDLARRLKIHPNTVGVAYQDLAAGGWVAAKSGSGVFVRDIKRSRPRDGIESFVAAWIEDALSHGYSLEAVRAEFDKASQTLQHRGKRQELLVVHADADFARILAAEIREGTRQEVRSAAVADLSQTQFDSCLILTTVSAAAAVSEMGSGRHLVIPLKTIDQVLSEVDLPKQPFLIGVVSRSETILKWASLLIAALGGLGNDVIQRNPDQPKWRDGLAACDMVVADVLTAAELPKRIRPVVLRLVPESFLDEVRKLVTVEKP